MRCRRVPGTRERNQGEGTNSRMNYKEDELRRGSELDAEGGGPLGKENQIERPEIAIGEGVEGKGGQTMRFG